MLGWLGRAGAMGLLERVALVTAGVCEVDEGLRFIACVGGVLVAAAGLACGAEGRVPAGADGLGEEFGLGGVAIGCHAPCQRGEQCTWVTSN